MEREFRLSIGLRIFYGILLSVLIIFFLGLGLSGLNAPGKNGAGALLFCFVIVIPCLLMLVNVFRSRVIISHHSIRQTTAFKTKELLFTNVKGCRVGQKVIYIDPVESSESPKITINNYQDFKDSDELKKWVSEKFTDLYGVSLTDEKQKFLQNEKYGLTEDERKSTLKKAKTVATVYNIAGFVLAFALIPFNDGPAAALIMMGFPLLGVIIMLTGKGLTKFSSSAKTSISPFVMPGMVLPMAMMLFKSLGEFEIYSYAAAWLPWALTGLVLFAVLYTLGINRSLPSKTAQVIMMAVTCCLYGFGTTIQLNCVFDGSEPRQYQTTVFDKAIHHGKSTTYTLTVKAWRAGNVDKKIEVGRHRYDTTQIGDTVTVVTKTGLLHIPWFYLSQ